jgi:type I site-specific restriction-modification system R (restriction) subunit
MAVSPEDLEEVLDSVKEEFLSAPEAQEKSIASEVPLAKSMLKSFVTRINDKVAKTERSLIEKVQTSNESPAISLVIAALKKKGYTLEVSGDKGYTQFIISW